MRPVPTVTAAVRRFRERYFEDNYVIGENIRIQAFVCHVDFVSQLVNGTPSFANRFGVVRP